MRAGRNLKPGTPEGRGLLSGLETVKAEAVISRWDSVKITEEIFVMYLWDIPQQSQAPGGDQHEPSTASNSNCCAWTAWLTLALPSSAQSKPSDVQQMRKSQMLPLRFPFFVWMLRWGGAEAASLKRQGFQRAQSAQAGGTWQHPALSVVDLNFRPPSAEPFITEHPLTALQGG